MERFKSEDPKGFKPVRIEQVFAEKPNGGIVTEPGFDAPATTAVYKNGDKYSVIKGYRLVEAITTGSTKIKIAKGSGVAKNDIIGYGTKAVACTAVSTTNEAYDEVTVTMGVAIAAGEVLYQAKTTSTDAAEPKGTPLFVTGNDLVGGVGDQPVRLINGANLRKATANIGKDVAALIPTINLV